MLEYKYGTDMDKAYDDLKKQMDLAKVTMPDEVSDPIMLELNANLMANMILAVSKDNTENLYNYVNDDIVPELEKLTSVAEVSINGGSKEYILSLIHLSWAWSWDCSPGTSAAGWTC